MAHKFTSYHAVFLFFFFFWLNNKTRNSQKIYCFDKTSSLIRLLLFCEFHSSQWKWIKNSVCPLFLLPLLRLRFKKSFFPQWNIPSCWESERARSKKFLTRTRARSTGTYANSKTWNTESKDFFFNPIQFLNNVKLYFNELYGHRAVTALKQWTFMQQTYH